MGANSAERACFAIQVSLLRMAPETDAELGKRETGGDGLVVFIAAADPAIAYLYIWGDSGYPGVGMEQVPSVEDTGGQVLQLPLVPRECMRTIG